MPRPLHQSGKKPGTPDKVALWLTAYRKGDTEALAKLVDHFRRPLFGYIVGMCPRQAEDLFQETWYHAIRSLSGFDGRNFGGWLFRIARNLVIDRSRRGRLFVDVDRGSESGDSMEERLPATTVRPDAVAAGHEIGDRLREAVARLPEEQREVFLLRMEGQVPFKEIAVIQKVSINTALARMQYALARLRSELGDVYKDFTA